MIQSTHFQATLTAKDVKLWEYDQNNQLMEYIPTTISIHEDKYQRITRWLAPGQMEVFKFSDIKVSQAAD
jgi:hypothetical protein